MKKKEFKDNNLNKTIINNLFNSIPPFDYGVKQLSYYIKDVRLITQSLGYLI